VDSNLKPHLERQVQESVKQKRAYSRAKNKSIAQLWCVIASMSKELFDLKLRLNYLEKTLQKTKKPHKK